MGQVATIDTVMNEVAGKVDRIDDRVGDVEKTTRQNQEDIDILNKEIYTEIIPDIKTIIGTTNTLEKTHNYPLVIYSGVIVMATVLAYTAIALMTDIIVNPTIQTAVFSVLIAGFISVLLYDMYGKRS